MAIMTIETFGPAYKHISIDLADAVASGSVQIGTLARYREMEGDRADRLEGATESTVNLETSLLKENDAVLLEKSGFHMRNIRNLKVKNCLVKYLCPNRYIFCCSDKPDYDYAEKESLAIFKILDLSRFAHLVTTEMSHVVRQPPVLGRVRYAERRSDLFGTRGTFSPDPFIKAHEFAWERELRICWRPLSEAPEPLVRGIVPTVISLLERLR